MQLTHEQVRIALAPYLVALSVNTSAHIENAIRRPSGTYQYFVSGCIFERNGVWCIATAGHVLKEFDAILHDKHTLRITVVDFFSTDALHHDPIPITYATDHAIAFDDDKVDFGLILLPENTAQLLQKNGIRAFGAHHWSHQPNDDTHEQCFVIGLPGNRQYIKSENATDLKINCCMTILRLDHKFDIPKEIAKQAPVWYGRIPYSDYQKADFRLQGMSGGPVVGIRQSDHETVTCFGIGMQYSCRHHEEHVYICVTPFYVIGRFLDALHKRFVSNDK